LPQYTVTLPSPFTAKKASTSLLSSTRGTVAAPCAEASLRRPVCKADGERASFEEGAARKTMSFDRCVHVSLAVPMPP
jgi:hypothetical protein